jgi:serine phosphatase RsbU (regulator of sigma subunit)
LTGGPADQGVGGPAWRCFDRQDVVNDGDRVFVPVSVRGDRWGVLRLGPAAEVDVIRPELPALGDLLAHELAAARPATDRYAAAARTRRLTLAAEMQWELLPGRSCSGDEFTLAGQLEPAYAVMGDTFDWAVDPDRLSVSVINGMGEGVAAASLSTLATHAIRNARRAGLGIVDQAMLADAALYAHHKGASYVSVLLTEIDLHAGRMLVVDMGSPVLCLVRGDAVTDVQLDRHDPLGMFDGSRYVAQEIQLEPGDRLVLVSDGVHAAIAGGRRYGEYDLRRLIGRCRSMPPIDVVRTLVGELRTFVAGDLADDAAAVCLDWSGRPSP